MLKSSVLVATFLTGCLIYQQTFKVIFGDGMIGYVIGDSDMITGFKLVGLEGVEATSTNEARQALNKVLTRTDVGIIIISDEFFTDSSIREEVDKIRQEQVTPLIIALPGSKGPTTEMQLSAIISKILGIKM
jgi:V/A-type H+-transporting ATPase subunit F